MKPSIAVDITARDKTQAGVKAAERGFGAFSRKTAGTAKESGLGKLGKQLDGLTKFKTLDFGFASAGRSLSTIGQVSGNVGAGLAAATERMLSFGAAGEGAMGVVAAGAATAAGAIAATAAAVVGLGVAAYALSDKWAKQGAEIDRTSRSLGVNAQQLQATRAAAERFGVTADATTGSIDGLQSTLYDAQAGGNNTVLGVLSKYGVQLKKTKDGAIDTYQALLDVSDIIARQKDPAVQKKLAQVFGVSGMLPALRQGSGALKAEGDDYLGSGAALTDAEVARSTGLNRKQVTLKQHLGAAEKTVGMGAEEGVDAVLGDHPGQLATRAITAIRDGATGLAHSGLQAGRALVEGGAAAGKEMAAAVRAARRDAGDRTAQMSAFLREIGFSRDQAQGMTAGAYAESHLDPHAVNPTSGALGIGQWLGARKKELIRQFGAAPSFEQQLQFMGWELNHTEASAGAAIRGADSAPDAMEAYVRRFMRPAPGAETRGDISRGGAFLERADRRPPATELASAAPPPGAPSKTQVEITLRGAPPGTVTRIANGGDSQVNLNVVRSLDGP